VNDATVGEVAFMGARPKDEIAEMMRSSDLFVLPSRFENCPAFSSAMTSGFRSSRLASGIPMISERDGILVPPTIGGVAEALDQVLANRISFDSDDIASRPELGTPRCRRGTAARVYDVVISTAHGKARRQIHAPEP